MAYSELSFRHCDRKAICKAAMKGSRGVCAQDWYTHLLYCGPAAKLEVYG